MLDIVNDNAKKLSLLTPNIFLLESGEMQIGDIDWDGIWREKQQTHSFSSDSESQERRWDQMASWYRFWSERDEYPSKLLQHVQMDREWSVLDIGCGIGTISIAAAMRAKRVTALDISTNMLDILKAEAERRHLGNIRYLHQTWESCKIGVDIKPHDVVVASRAIARTGDLRESLKKINNAARQYAYVTAWGGESGGFSREFLEAIGRSYTNSPDDVFVFNILHQMDIHPNVEQLECHNPMLYTDHEHALQSYQMLLNLTPEETDPAREFLKTHMIRRRDGRYVTPETGIRWSLFWWRK